MSKIGTALTFLVLENPNVQLDQEDLLTYGFYKAYMHDGYVMLSYQGKKVMLHRLVMGMPNCQIDHINRDRADNRKSNLRLVTNQQNSFNSTTGINNSSGYKGVSWSKAAKAWEARLMLNGRSVYLGLHRTKEEAAARYNEAAAHFFGEYAALNQLA